jgi:Asp-tRNA(Asn)/Glu-tRNA(Gln) amidotransferase A subunit family amidase
MTTDFQLCYMPAHELTTRMARREISPIEVVRNSLARIEEVNAKLNCFCSVFPEDALARARQAENALFIQRPIGLLHGVPVAIKDMTPIKGKRTTMGSHVYANWVPDQDALIVERLIAAGAILIGKTTTPEFAYSSITESPLWGVTRNPWNIERNAGGSSGGSAVAVAAGCVPLAEGSDMGGSVRIPASFCGIVGMKPSFGRIPFTILPSQFDLLPHFGPLARNAQDAALFLEATQGSDDRDILSQRTPSPVGLPLRDIEGIRIAFAPDLGYYAVHPEVLSAVSATARSLASCGAVVDEFTLGWSSRINAAWNAHWTVFLAAFYGHHLGRWRAMMDPNLVRLIEIGQQMSAVEFKKHEIERTEHWRMLARVFSDYDVLICPTTPVPAPPNGMPEHQFEFHDAAGRYHSLDMTAPFSCFGLCPALSVPCGFTEDGLPVGLQIVGRRYEDETVLRIGAALERLWPWSRRRPAIAPQSSSVS